ncbi:LPD7 domain-containing protein [Magnetospirillum sulfuroxidans]|uniref:Toprim domain-containing protein n=1 Tax=Magnetospirillum sulfuroxidans TaxID=611300 RepID=A0ABS5IHC2_9PROT|nr:LPD7 domain-containing protein [Magnetospirillum sulfuroxidans]MBR9973785.1 toprim domain-containing protein [Magnetospirillum sulfuroxidans]
MMVMWSKHTGSDDAGGDGVVAYMQDEYVWKAAPDGGRERLRRVPPPEVLKGDATLMRQAIRATPFSHRYSSAVLSFERDDIDVARFNAGDPELRRRVSELIQAFEDSAYAGIPEQHRPPMFWTTHTHTGRLELNFCAPRAILAADGRLRAINPHPPGNESRRLFDAFRDVWNCLHGWADPEDPARTRLTKVPDWAQKIAAEARRAGREPKKHLTEKIGEWAEAAFAAGMVTSRAGLIAQLQAEGIDVPRIGDDYITISSQGGSRIRLRGRLFSSAFTSPEAIAPVLPRGARLDLAECEARLALHRSRRAEFHRRRYGGPDWNEPEETALPNWGMDEGLGDGQEPDVCAIAETSRRQRYQVRLWLLIWGGTLPEDLLMALRWIDRNSRTIRLTDGAAVTDHGDRITSSRSTHLAAKLMIAEAAAKGWTSIHIAGSPEFQQLAIGEALRAGLTISNPELQHLVRRLTMTQEDANGADPNGAGIAPNRRSPSGGSDIARDAAERADRGFDQAIGRLGDGLRHLGKAARPGVTRIYQARQDELTRFKEEIDLCAVAATLGFAEDKAASSRNHRVMRHADDTKLIIGTSKAGHWAFSSNAGKSGTVIDLLKWRLGLDMSACREHLRPWIGEPANRPTVDLKLYTSKPKPTPAPADRMKAISEWEGANPSTRSVFLERSRGLSPQTLASDRFKGTFRVDERQNAVFAYRDGTGAIVGTERRNRPPAGSDRSFKVYTSGAAPGIWTSNGTAEDRRLVVIESPIDAMSHWQMLSAEEQAVTRYAAIRSGFREEDLETIIRAMPAGAGIVAACDPDSAGDAYTQKIMAAAERADRMFREERPEGGDWNYLLRRPTPMPAKRPHPTY